MTGKYNFCCMCVLWLRYRVVVEVDFGLRNMSDSMKIGYGNRIKSISSKSSNKSIILSSILFGVIQGIDFKSCNS